MKRKSLESADECPTENVNGDTDKESDSNRNNGQETNSDISECEKDGFSGFADFDSNDNSMPLPPSNLMEGTLTILAPSEVNNTVANALNNSVNGSLESEQSESVSEAFSALGGLTNESNNDIREGLTVLSPAELGASSNTNYVNILQNLDSNSINIMWGYLDQSNSDNMEYMPLDRLACETCEVCGERAPDRASMEQHKASVGHYKCHMSADCAVVLFGSAAELSNHQQTTHGAPPPPPVQQLAQQVCVLFLYVNLILQYISVKLIVEINNWSIGKAVLLCADVVQSQVVSCLQTLIINYYLYHSQNNVNILYEC